jgi:hypothetical protein
MCPIFNAFVTAATSCAQYEQAWPNCNCLNADINGDGMVSQADINPFVTLLSGGGNSGLSQTYVWTRRTGWWSTADVPGAGEQPAEADVPVRLPGPPGREDGV